MWSAARFSKEIDRQAEARAPEFQGHLSHPVGTAVHDVGNYRLEPLREGLVFSVDPMLWVHEERRYIRMEDVVAVTAQRVENFTDFLPVEMAEIEKVMREEGLLQRMAPQYSPGGGGNRGN